MRRGGVGEFEKRIGMAWSTKGIPAGDVLAAQHRRGRSPFEPTRGRLKSWIASNMAISSRLPYECSGSHLHP